MKELYKNHLFNKRILVSDEQEPTEGAFEAVFAFARKLAIKIGKGKRLASVALIEYAASQLGKNVPQSFYKGFPKSVRLLTKEELLFDQLVHYVQTYGFDNFEDPGYSIFEEDFKRTAFREKVTPKDFDILTEQEAVKVLEEYVKNLLSSTRPLNDAQYEVVRSALADYGFVIDECPCKDTAIRLLYDTRNVDFAKLLKLSDFIKLVEMVNFYGYENTNPKKLNLKNKDRVLLTKSLDCMIGDGEVYYRDCFEKQGAWRGVLHHLHYKPKTEQAAKFVAEMRNAKNGSAYAAFEKMMGAGDIIGAVSHLVKAKGAAALMRNLNYVLSRCTSEEQVAFVMSKVDTPNNVVLIQMLMQYYNYREQGSREFKFTRFNRLIVHEETKEETARRKSVISKETAEKIVVVLKENLRKNLHGKLGKVYVDKAMQKIALPIQENTALGGFGTLPKGSRIDLPAGKKVRAFTYWERVDDIDLSLIGLSNTLKQYEFSWRTMYKNQSAAILFSGDQTSGYKGGSEFYDLDFERLEKKYPDCRYYILCDNVFSGTPFNQCVCRAGFMMRDGKDSGEVFEPKTVASALTVDCASTFAYLYAIDVERRQIVWLNVSRQSNEIVAGQTSLGFLLDYLNATDVINVYTLFEMLASELVDDPTQADVVVTDEQVEIKEGAVLIRSFDNDKILPLING